MEAELVYTTTADDIRLDGAFFTPQHAPSSESPSDAMLLVGGSGGTFYGPSVLMAAARFRDAGYAVVSFNTRGHDLVARSAAGRLCGASYEVLDECRLDLDAAITWLEQRGYRRVGLRGSSMGAVKVVYYQAHVQDPRVTAVIAVSPVRLSHSYYLQSEAAEEYRRFYEQAKTLVEAAKEMRFSTLHSPYL